MMAFPDKIILPGVGHFGHCLKSLSSSGYLPAIRAHIDAGKPFFGICVGLQALFEGSEEAGDVQGLGLIGERLFRFREDGSGGGRCCAQHPGIGHVIDGSTAYLLPKEIEGQPRHI
jgi:imidazoleglycerol phosphate synthase glutamine amidotransferase subunit HisH